MVGISAVVEAAERTLEILLGRAPSLRRVLKAGVENDGGRGGI